MEKKLLITTLVVLFSTATTLFAQCDNAQKKYISDNIVINPGFEQGNVEINTLLKYFGDCRPDNSLQEPESYLSLIHI